MICNARELAAQKRGVAVIDAKTDGQVAKFAECLPKEYAVGLGEISTASRVVCNRHKGMVLTKSNGGAWVGPCGCGTWCIDCAGDPSKMICLKSQAGILPRGRDAEDGYVCFACHEDVEEDFTAVKTDKVVQIADAVNGVIDGLHEFACAQEADQIEAVRDPDPAAGIREEAAPKVKKFSIQWFRNEAGSELGPDADPEAVEANAKEAAAAHKKALADKRQERDDEKNALKRVRELEEELACEQAKRFKFQEAFEMALAKGHADGHWDRDEVEEEIMEQIVDADELLGEDVEEVAAEME